MAESCKRAFGRYLRTLRERRGLSLTDVASLSQTFPERINKGFLSRVENGLQGMGFSKLIPLSRIYEVPSDVLVERMELDLELDRIGGPDTEGKDYSELVLAAKQALIEGNLWVAYALTRDAIQRSVVDGTRASFSSPQEQYAITCMNCATIARSIGRIDFALFEYEFLETSGNLGPRYLPLLLERISLCHLALGSSSDARAVADRAIAAAESIDDAYATGYSYSTRATIASQEEDYEKANYLYRRSYEAFRHGGFESEQGRTLHNLAESYFLQHRNTSARRALAAATKFLVRNHQKRTLALGRILLGEIALVEHRLDAAKEHGRDAVKLASSIKDRTVVFQAEFFLYRQAIQAHHPPAVRSIRRRLKRLSAWVPRNLAELEQFRKIAS